MTNRSLIGLLMARTLTITGCSEDPVSRIRHEAKQLKVLDWNHLSGLPQPGAVVSAIGHQQPAIAAIRQCQALTSLIKLFEDPLFAPSELGSLPENGRQLRSGYVRYMEQNLY